MLTAFGASAHEECRRNQKDIRLAQTYKKADDARQEFEKTADQNVKRWNNQAHLSEISNRLFSGANTNFGQDWSQVSAAVASYNPE